MKAVVSCGIDVGLKSHMVCLLGKGQEIIKRYAIVNDIEGFSKLVSDITKNTLICLEPTGVYGINLFVYFRKKGYDIKFCGTDSSFYFRRAMFGSKKHDKLDCISLAKYRLVNEQLTFDGAGLLEKLFQRANYQNNKKCLVLSELLDEYTKKAKKSSILKQKIKCIVDLRFPEAIQIFPYNRGCKTILKALCYSKEDILKGKVELERLSQIQKKIKSTIGQYDLRVAEFKDHVEELNRLQKQMKELRGVMKEKLHEMGYSPLFGYPGLDTVNIAVLVCEIGDIERFFKYSQNGQFNKKRSLKSFKEFLGIAVTSNQSGEHEGGHKLVKSGNMKLRTTLFLMVLTYISMKNKEKTGAEKHEDLDPYRFKSLYEKLVDSKVKKKVAITKVMNKIATDLFFILKENPGSHSKKQRPECLTALQDPLGPVPLHTEEFV